MQDRRRLVAHASCCVTRATTSLPGLARARARRQADDAARAPLRAGRARHATPSWSGNVPRRDHGRAGRPPRGRRDDARGRRAARADRRARRLAADGQPLPPAGLRDLQLRLPRGHRSGCRTTRGSPPTGAPSSSAHAWTSTRPRRSRRSPARSRQGCTAIPARRRSATRRPRRARRKTARTQSSCASPPTPACAAASSWRCAGTTSTSRAASWSCGARSAAASRPARRSLAGRARCRSPTRRRARWTASPSAATSRTPTTTCSPTASVADSTARRCAAGSSVRARPPVCARCAFHDLRHTYGSLLVAGGIDLASVKAAMGHSRITTTERYLHARSASELADRFTRALATDEAATITDSVT